VTRRQFLALLVPLLLVIGAFVVLWTLERRGTPPWDTAFANRVREAMGREFVGGTGDERQQWQAYFNAMQAYARTFDGYAEIPPPWELQRRQELSSGRYTGIGVRIDTSRAEAGPESVFVTGVKPGGPAAVAGVAVGDRIVAVDGRSMAEILLDGRPAARLSETPLQAAIRGLEGTAVVLRLRAPDGSERDARVVRAQVDEGTVLGARFLDPAKGIGYVRLAGFRSSTAKDLRAELEKLAKAGLKALVLDLRGNLGGFLDQAVLVANLFLEDGVIVRQRGRMAQFNAIYRAERKETWDATIPLAVLLNDGSASASEVLGGALLDHRRAVLVGERTFGKFLVQLVEEVPTEAGMAMFKRTTSIYETPLGKSYQRTPPDNENDALAGIPPDLFVPMTKEDRERLALVFEDESYADWDPGRAPRVEGFRDPQIEAARALLAGEAVCPALAP
jgi:carboxyl-terminal processing protease